MPSYWSKKDERQYQHILESCQKPKKICKRIASATVNKQRRREGRTLLGALFGFEQISQYPTTVLNTGDEVLAVLYRGKPSAVTYFNPTQANARVVKLGPNWETIRLDRVWYIRKR